MLKIATVTLLILAIASIGARAAPAPAALLGRSIVLTWSETRQQRKLGDQNFRSIMQATISACTLAVLAAHSFVKLSGQAWGAGSEESHMIPSFAGRMMTLIPPFRSGGMGRDVMSFYAPFDAGTATSCLCYG